MKLVLELHSSSAEDMAMLKKIVGAMECAGADAVESSVIDMSEIREKRAVNAVPTPEPKKRGRPPKAKAPEVETEEDEAEEEASDDGDDFGFDDEAEAPAKLTLESDIIPAIKAFADKYTREKAKKVLDKFSIKTVRDLPKDKYESFMKVLKSGKI